MSDSASNPTNPSEQLSGLEKLLRAFTDIRAGEGVTALVLTFNVFLILTCYYIIKPVRDALVITLEGGAELKSYAGGASAILLLVAVPAYSALANRLARNRLIVSVTLFFVGCLVVFYGLSLNEDFRPKIAIPFYLWVAIFGMMIVSQFWAFANDVYDKEQGKRLFPMVGIGASAGSLVGALLAAALPELEAVSVYTLMLGSAGILGVTAFLTQWVHVRETARINAAGTTTVQTPEAQLVADEEDKQGAFSMVLRNRYLLLLAAFHLLFTLVNTNGEYMVGAVVKQAVAGNADLTTDLARANFATQFYAQFYLGVNILGLIIQSFLVSRIIKYGGFKVAFFVLPAIALGGAVAIAALPVLMVVRIGKTLENSTDYSLNNTLRHMLWLPTSRAQKYKAKQAVDTFFVRMGDITSAGFVYVAAGIMGLGVRTFAIANIVLIVGWFALAGIIARRYAKAEEPEPSAQPT